MSDEPDIEYEDDDRTVDELLDDITPQVNVCHRNEPASSDEFYDDTCANHPNGCHVIIKAPGVEFHPHPAYKRPPTPGALEAEKFDSQIEDAHALVKSLKEQRMIEHNAAYESGHN